MSVGTDDQGNMQVTMSTLWGFVFKAAAALAIPMMLMLLSWGTWVTVKVSAHDSDIAVLKACIDYQRGGNGVSQSVNVGSAKDTAETQAAEYRDFFTVEEVAKRVGYSVRSIQAMCAAGEIEGAVQPEGTRGWQIPKDFKFRGSLPQTAAVSGELPQPEP